MNVWEVLAAIAIVGFVIVCQLRGEPLRGKRLIVLPLVLSVIGAVDLGKHGAHLSTADIVCLAVSALLAASIGAGQGAMTRIEEHEGFLWVRTPPRALWLWAALVASRLVMTLVAQGLGAHVAASFAPVLMLLGVNRLGQAATVAPRALATGVPFAPEKDGRSFAAGGLQGARYGDGGAGVRLNSHGNRGSYDRYDHHSPSDTSAPFDAFVRADRHDRRARYGRR